MATVTPGYTFTNDEVVTPAKLNSAASPVVEIASSEVTESKIATNAVTSTKIANGAVTQEKLNSSVTLVPTGAIMPFAMNSAPSGWLAADGTEYSKTGIYAGLFAVIQTTYGETNGAGGTGMTHFRVPDLRGYFVRGSGTNTDGTASGTFGTKQADGVISHTHSGTTGNDSPDHTHGYMRSSFATQSGGSINGAISEYSTSTGGASTRHQHAFTTSSQSPAGTTETRPKNIAMLYCIKA